MKQETRGHRHSKISKTVFKPKLVRRDRKDISCPLKEKKNLPIGYHTSKYIHTHHKYILFLKEIILYAKPPIGENTVIVVIFIAHPPIDNPEKSILIKKYWS